MKKYGGIFDKNSINNSILKLQELTANPNFWDDNNYAQKTLKEISRFKNELKIWEKLEELYSEVESYLELLNEGEDIADDADGSLKLFADSIEKIQIHKLLNKPDDQRNAILTIHPGAGGIDSQDWASMLFRLYSRWCEQRGYKIKILDYQDGLFEIYLSI